MDDFSGLEYDQDSVSEEDVVIKTNNLLSQFNLPTQVSRVSDITASLFVVLYESLFSDRLPDIVRQPVTREDEIANCQMVIDVLSADVIKDNLSHIRGVDIVEGKVQAINNLLDIFTFLFEYVIKQIESDVPTDTDDDARSLDRLEGAAEDTESFEAGLEPLEIGKRDTRRDELKDTKGRTESNGSAGVALPGIGSYDYLRAAANGNGAAPVAAMRSKTMAVTAPSPIPPNISTSLMDQGTLDSTADLIKEAERFDRHLAEERPQPAPKTAWSEPREEGVHGPFDYIGVRPVPNTQPFDARADVPRTASSLSSRMAGQDAVLESDAIGRNGAMSGEPFSSATAVAAATSVSHPPASQYSAQNMSATVPLPSRNQRPRSPGTMRRTVGAFPYHSGHTLEKPYQQRSEPIKGLSTSYEDLNQIVQNTAAMTRAAVDTSPMRRHQDHAARLDITDLSQRPERLQPPEGLTLARELNQGDSDYLSAHPYSSGDPVEFGIRSKGQRQGAIPHERSAVKEPIQDHRSHFSRDDYRIPPNTDYVRSSAREKSKPVERREPDRHTVSPPKSNLKQQRHTANVDDALSIGSETNELVTMLRQQGKGKEVDDMAAARRRRTEVKERQAKLSSRLHEMGKPMLAGAQRRLETEDRMYQHKQGFVKRLYQEEFGEAVEEVQSLVDREHRLMKDMEEEYRKLMLVATGKPLKKPLKAAPRAKGFLLPTTKKGKSVRPAKTRRKTSSAQDAPRPRDRPLSLAEDEDLMPVLLEEFPHLYLSEHSWHELWRRGITQIENLTRAYEENKRRKSKAQVQLEEAAKKHEVLAAMVKKQLEHSQRMEQIKDQKKQQVGIKNRVQEKRSQSARARRYYNEYQVRARAKMLKRRTKEEMIFKNLFKDGLAIQKERIQEVRRYAKEQRDKQAQKRQDEIDSLENFYRDQFELLVEKLFKDKEDMTARETAHHKMLDQMKRELRRKMEKEIKGIQSEMFRDDDDVYLRQLEADRLRHELLHAKYQTRV